MCRAMVTRQVGHPNQLCSWGLSDRFERQCDVLLFGVRMVHRERQTRPSQACTTNCAVAAQACCVVVCATRPPVRRWSEWVTAVATCTPLEDMTSTPFHQTAVRRRRRLFTLLELIIVLVVLGVLAGIVIPQFFQVQARAEDAAVTRSAEAVDEYVRQVALLDNTTRIRNQQAADDAAKDLGNELTEVTVSDNFTADGQISIEMPNAAACLHMPERKGQDSQIVLGQACSGSPPPNITPNVNLVTNGSGEAGDDTNWSRSVYDATESADGTPGSFVEVDYWQTVLSDEIVPVDPYRTYELSAQVKGDPDTGQRFYLGVAPYDADGRGIRAYHHMYFEGTTTTLAAPLEPGDTTVQLADADGWQDAVGPRDYQRSIIFWTYTNDSGYAYPAETYSRYKSPRDSWDDGAIDFGTNTITLNSPWSYNNPDRADGVWPAGTEVSNSNSGGTYKYIAAGLDHVQPTWTEYSGTLGGVDYSGRNKTRMFPPGTTGVRVLWLHNRHGGDRVAPPTPIDGAATYFDAVSVQLTD